MFPRILFFFLLLLSPLRGEVILQYFGTSWGEIERRIPELAEAGYTALWLPPPFKAGGGSYSVGFDTLDRFDLGDKDQSGTLPTRYGSRADLERLMVTAHRFGFRVYFDNVMAHTAGPLDPVPPGTLLPGVPGFVPEDMHLGWNGSNWQKFADYPDYNNEWEVLNRNPFAWDIAQESPNTSFDDNGLAEGSDFPKWVGIRHPDRPEYYLDTDLTVAINGQGNPVHPFANQEPFDDVGVDGSPNTGDSGEGNGRFDFTDSNANGQHDAGEPSEPFIDTGVDGSNPNRQTTAWGYGDGIYNMGNPVAEDVNLMLFRAIRWFVQEIKPDGFRLDAVKHVPSYFFGEQSGADKDLSNAGYNGSIQEHFNLTRGYSDWNNHRDTVFSLSVARDDAMLFGEHLGEPPAADGYRDAGMRVATDQMLNNVANNIGGNLTGLDAPGYGFVFGDPATSMSYVMSHDNTFLFGGDRAAALPYMILKEGLPIVYTDGYNESGAPDYFPKPADINFLGQFSDTSVTGALAIHNDLARGGQRGLWSDSDFLAFERFDGSEQGPGAGSWNDATLLLMMARNYIGGGHGRGDVVTGFPAGAALRNQSPYGGDFVAVVQGDGKVRDTSGNVILVPSGGYFAFGWRRPQLPDVWSDGPAGERQPIEIYQNGERASMMTVTRRDGVDGDPNFNPLGLAGQSDGDFSYEVQIPRVTGGAPVRFVARSDGSAENILMKLDGGVDLNSQMGFGPSLGAKRDFPPGINSDLRDDQGDGDLSNDLIRQSSTDTYLGYEQMRFVGRYNERFAASDVSRNVAGSLGAETWTVTIGEAGVSVNNGNGPNSGQETASWIYHDPAADNQLGSGDLQLSPAPEDAVDSSITVWVKVGYENEVDRAHLYYTMDGSVPEGSAGVGKGTTKVVALTDTADGNLDGGTMQTRWWSGQVPALPEGIILTYKVGGHRDAVSSRFPFSEGDHTDISRMETVFEVADFEPENVIYHPHNDYGKMATGLAEGYHVLRTRPFVGRNDGASIFRTNVQTFYYDASRTEGQIAFPEEGDQLGGSSYEVVVLTDASVTEVRFQILDDDAGNDGAGNGSWASASLQRPTAYLRDSGAAREWRFEYQNIPTTGSAAIQVRLMEDSSSSNMALNDEEGWFTTLTRNVIVGSGRTWSISQPAEGEVVDEGSVMRVAVSKELVGELSDEDFLSEVRVLIGSTVSASPSGAVLQPLSSYRLIRDVNGVEHAVEFTFENLYNGDSDFLHHVRVLHRRAEQTLTDVVRVKMAPGALADSDGDGLPDLWESENGLQPGNPFGEHGAEGDYDFDGLSNEEEYIYGLSPTLADAHLAPTVALVADDSNWDVNFPGIPGRLHTLLWSEDLENWNPLVSDLETAEDIFFSVDDDADVPRRFYRVEYRMKF
ncbi:hypothetical protein AAFN60_04285 [Roseibacillus persicicus]|uniref:hypothetical protein n=1 Tax=Roseibacillus persicicus TaxID=454148 RepID=UPI00398B7F92